MHLDRTSDHLTGMRIEISRFALFVVIHSFPSNVGIHPRTTAGSELDEMLCSVSSFIICEQPDKFTVIAATKTRMIPQ